MNKKLESELWAETPTTSDIQSTPPLWQSEGELTSLLRVKEESEEPGLKLSLKKLRQWRWLHRFIPGGGKGGALADFIFLSSVTADVKLRDPCSLEEKPRQT